MRRSFGLRRRREFRYWTVLFDVAGVLGLSPLGTLACCGWLVIQWLSLALYAVGGAATFRVLARYEAAILFALGGIEFVAVRLARDRIGQFVNAALGALAVALGVVRLLWEFDRGVVLGVDPLYAVFVHRQQVLLLGLGLAAAVRLAAWLPGRRRFTASICQRSSPRLTVSSPAQRTVKDGREL